MGGIATSLSLLKVLHELASLIVDLCHHLLSLCDEVLAVLDHLCGHVIQPLGDFSHEGGVSSNRVLEGTEVTEGLGASRDVTLGIGVFVLGCGRFGPGPPGVSGAFGNGGVGAGIGDHHVGNEPRFGRRTRSPRALRGN